MQDSERDKAAMHGIIFMDAISIAAFNPDRGFDRFRSGAVARHKIGQLCSPRIVLSNPLGSHERIDGLALRTKSGPSLGVVRFQSGFD